MPLRAYMTVTAPEPHLTILDSKSKLFPNQVFLKLLVQDAQFKFVSNTFIEKHNSTIDN